MGRGEVRSENSDVEMLAGDGSGELRIGHTRESAHILCMGDKKIIEDMNTTAAL